MSLYASFNIKIKAKCSESKCKYSHKLENFKDQSAFISWTEL